MIRQEKGYIILGLLPTGDYIGYTEETFSMGVSTSRVKLYSLLNQRIYVPRNSGGVLTYTDHKAKQHKMKYNSANQENWFFCKKTCERLNDKNWRKAEWKVYRVSSSKCPVDVDLSEIIQMKNKHKKYDKYLMRNIPFRKRQAAKCEKA